MKRLFCWALVSVLIAAAQTTSDQERAARMARHLLPAVSALTLPDPVRDEVYSPAEVKSLSTPSLRRVMDAYAQDLREVEFKNTHLVQNPNEATPTFRPFTSPDQAYKLVHSLVGKDVTEASLIPLCTAIVRLVRSSVECRNASCEFRKDDSARDAAEAVQTALQSIGLRDVELRAVSNSILRGAIVASTTERTFYR